jgi:hypothetical protein
MGVCNFVGCSFLGTTCYTSLTTVEKSSFKGAETSRNQPPSRVGSVQPEWTGNVNVGMDERVNIFVEDSEIG